MSRGKKYDVFSNQGPVQSLLGSLLRCGGWGLRKIVLVQ